MIKKIILLTGLMISTNVWAEIEYIESDEQEVCYIRVTNLDMTAKLPRHVGTYLDKQRCREGDIIDWKISRTIEYKGLGQHMVSAACNQDKQINVMGENWLQGVCTYTGKVLALRNWGYK